MKFKDVPKPNTNQVLKTEVVNSAAYIPIDDLPSKYLYYPEGCKIFAKPMSTKNIKSLANTNEDNYNSIFNHVIGDNIRGLNYGSSDAGYEMEFYCPSCKTNSNYKFGVNVFDVNYAKEDQNLELTLPESKDKLKIKYVTVGDETKYDEFKRTTAKNIKDFDEDFLSYALEIDTINDESLSLLKKYEYIINMHPLDYAYLNSFLDSITFGVKESINAKCSKCGGTAPIGVNFREICNVPIINFG